MTTAEQQAPAGRRTKRLLVLALALVVALASTVWYLVRPAPVEPVAGEVMTLEPLQVNLAAGHYLRVGLALQLTEEVESLDGSRALDAAISVLSGREVSELTTGPQREKVREQLLQRMEMAYEGDVMDVYFTDFVTQ